MTPMTCWTALLTGQHRDYRELFTESGPFFIFIIIFFFYKHKFLVFTLNSSFNKLCVHDGQTLGFFSSAHTWGPFHKAGLTNSESNPEL